MILLYPLKAYLS